MLIDQFPRPRESTNKRRHSWWQCLLQNDISLFHALFISGLISSLYSFFLRINFTKGNFTHLNLLIELFKVVLLFMRRRGGPLRIFFTKFSLANVFFLFFFSSLLLEEDFLNRVSNSFTLLEKVWTRGLASVASKPNAGEVEGTLDVKVIVVKGTLLDTMVKNTLKVFWHECLVYLSDCFSCKWWMEYTLLKSSCLSLGL